MSRFWLTSIFIGKCSLRVSTACQNKQSPCPMSCTAPVLGFGAMRAYPRQRHRKTFPENAPVFLHRRAPTFDSEQGAWGLHGVRDMFGRMPAIAGSDQLKPTENDMFGF